MRSVPVTTVPKPFIEKTRSIGNRGGPSDRRRRVDEASPASARRSSGNALPGAGRYDEDRGVVEERAGDQFLDLEANDVEHTLVRQIGLGENDEPCRDAQQAADLEVLARLRHHRLIGGHMQHDEVDTPDTGEHVA